MSFENKLEAALRELKKTGIWEDLYNPPISRLLRKAGLKIKPFHYLKFLTNFLWFATVFGIGLGTLMWFIDWPDTMNQSSAIINSILVGVGLGLFTAFYYHYLFKKHNLTDWNDL